MCFSTGDRVDDQGFKAFLRRPQNICFTETIRDPQQESWQSNRESETIGISRAGDEQIQATELKSGTFEKMNNSHEDRGNQDVDQEVDIQYEKQTGTETIRDQEEMNKQGQRQSGTKRRWTNRDRDNQGPRGDE